MKQIRAYKTELDPNNKQRTWLGRCCGAARFVYNWGLAEWQEQYELGGYPSQYALCRYFNSIKTERCPWIRELPYAVTEAALANLGTAFKHFFRRVKAGQTPGYPKFKKRGRSSSFQLCSTRVERDRVRLTGLGWVRLKERGYIPTTDSGVKFGGYATISERAGRWYISVLTMDDTPVERNDSTLVIGIDFGLKTLAVCSDGTTYENPRPLREAQRQLKRVQRELTRRKKGGKNWQKTKLRLQRQYAKVTNIRTHTLHHISRDVVNKNPGVIVIEDLNVAGMVKNHKLAQAIMDVSFAELRRQIEYKAKWAGIDVVVVSQWFPSSKACSGCGCVKDDLTLGDRVYHCDDCGLEIDRDLNAALNLAAMGEPRNTGGLPGELAGS